LRRCLLGDGGNEGEEYLECLFHVEALAELGELGTQDGIEEGDAFRFVPVRDLLVHGEQKIVDMLHFVSDYGGFVY